MEAPVVLNANDPTPAPAPLESRTRPMDVVASAFTVADVNLKVDSSVAKEYRRLTSSRHPPIAPSMIRCLAGAY
jgi:hypothetical protein